MLNNVSQLLEDLDKSSRIVVDVETHKTITFEGKTLMGVAFAIPHGIDIITHYIETQYLGTILQELRGKELIFHNAKFDLQILQDNGYEHKGVVWDTMIMAHLVNENRVSFELDQLARIYFNERKMSMNLIEKAFGKWEKIPALIMGEYAEQDVRLTYRLFSRLLSELEKQDLLQLWPDCQDYILALKRMCSVGIDVDWNALQGLSHEAQQQMAAIEKELGFIPSKRKQLEGYLFKQLGVKQNGTSLDDTALREYAAQLGNDTSAIDKILQYRKLQKADSTWYQGFLKRRGPTDRLYPGLKQHGTRTGRLSCSEPNLQQIPRDAERVKRLFLSRPGYKLIEFDYSQIELRVGCRYAKKFGDDRMYEAYVEDIDVHDLTSQLIKSYDVIENRSEARQVGKTGNFLWIYGGSAVRLQNMLWEQYGIRASLSQCEVWTSKFHQSYPGFKVAGQQSMKAAAKRGFVKYWNGRRRHLASVEAHKAFNSLVQGGCGQVLMNAAIQLDRLQESGALRSRISNTVHDSIWALVPVDDEEQECELICKTMSSIPERIFDLPFPVDLKVLAC
jgi:DNA polymerase I-like protein with 3'-5' exonuclease and polymerase domains